MSIMKLKLVSETVDNAITWNYSFFKYIIREWRCNTKLDLKHFNCKKMYISMMNFQLKRYNK